MRLLLDTHAVIWWTGSRGKVSPAARAIICDPGNDILVSAASAWEIAIKVRSGKLHVAPELMDDFDGCAEGLGWNPLAIRSSHTLLAARLPGPHKDPFDRLLAAQAIIENLTIASLDTALLQLGARVIW